MLEDLKAKNAAWSRGKTEVDPQFFKRLENQQSPEYLWIGCSDSRVPANEIVGLDPGELFVHRNVANLAPPQDANYLSVLQFAVDVLKVRHVILCGHHGCGGVLATMEGGTQGPVDRWLANARDVLHRHQDEIDAQPDQAAKVNRLVEVNVMEQLRHLARLDTIQKAFAEKRELWLHGWVYDIRDGHIKTLLEIDADTDLDGMVRPDKVLV